MADVIEAQAPEGPSAYDVALEELLNELNAGKSVQAATRPRATGGIPTGTNFVPPIPTSGTIRNANTPLGDMTTPGLAPIVSSVDRGLDAVARTGGKINQMARDLAYEGTGIPAGGRAGTNLAEAVETSDPLRGAAAIGQGVLATLPMRMPSGVIDALGQGVLRAGVPAAASTALLPIPAFAGQTEDVMELQRKLKASGDYAGKIDGQMGETTKAAAKAFNEREERRRQQEIELKGQANKEAEEARKIAEAQKTAEDNRIRDERMQGAERDLPLVTRIVRDFGPTLGAAVGIAAGGLTRKGVLSKSNQLSTDLAARADRTLEAGAGRDWAGRVGAVNQFWTDGRAGAKVPFLPAPGNSPPFRSNPAAVPSGDLYQSPRLNNLIADTAVTGTAMAESGFMQFKMLPDAEKEVEEARAALQLDPSQSNVSRLQTAIAHKASVESLMNLGRGAAASYIGSSLYKPRTNTRPNVAGAEAERIRIDEALNRASGVAAPRQPGPQPLRSQEPRQLPAPASDIAAAAPDATTQSARALPAPKAKSERASTANRSSSSAPELPDGYKHVPTGKGSTIQGPDGRFAKMPPEKRPVQIDDMRPMGRNQMSDE